MPPRPTTRVGVPDPGAPDPGAPDPPAPDPPAAEPLAWPPETGEMAERVRRHDWSATPLGPTAGWPQSLCTAVELILGSPMAMIILWGPRLVQIYNDGYRAIMGAKHPAGLGQPTQDCWPEVWNFTAPVYEAVWRGEALSYTDHKLILERRGRPEPAWFDLCYSPIRDGAGAIAGILVTVVETTGKVLAERQQGFLLRLEARLRPLREPNALLAAAGEEILRHSGAAQVAYAGVDATGETATVERKWNDGTLTSKTGPRDLLSPGGAFAEDLRRGRTITIADVREDPRTAGEPARQVFAQAGIRSLVDVPLVRGGRLAAVLAIHDREPRPWRPEDVAVLQDAAGRTWDAVERVRSEQRLRDSEERYRTLFSSIDEGFCVLERVATPPGEPPDFRLQAINPAFARHSGLPKAVGRTLLDLLPEADRTMLALLDRVVRSGEPIRFEQRVAALGRWIDGYAFRIEADGRRVALLFTDVTERKRIEEALSGSEERLRLALDVGRLGTWDWDLTTGRLTWSDEHYRMLGFRPGEVEPSYPVWLDRIHPDDREATLAAVDAARTGSGDYDHDYRTLHPDGSIAWHSARGRFFRDAAGRPVRMIGVMEDTTERRRWEETQQVLVAELQHRTRNLLAVVQALSGQILARSDSLESFRHRFNDRLAALSRIQGLLSRSQREPITIAALLRMELDALGAEPMRERIRLEGPVVPLRAGIVQTLALALHELATNARKYGALASDHGRLSVGWEVDVAADGSRRLLVEWSEEGLAEPPPEDDTARRGYGRELIEVALPFALGAETRYRLGRDGVHCTIALPLTAGARSAG